LINDTITIYSKTISTGNETGYWSLVGKGHWSEGSQVQVRRATGSNPNHNNNPNNPGG